MEEKFISIAKILNFHGIKGEAKLGFSKGREKQIQMLKRVYVERNGIYETFNVEAVRFHKHFAIVKFKEFSTVNDVEYYKGCDIYLTKKEIEDNLDEDEFLINDLIGMDVFDEDGAYIGKIAEIGENLANNILSVQDNNGKKHLVPFVKELVPVVDLKGKKVVVNNIEGLIN